MGKKTVKLEIEVLKPPTMPDTEWTDERIAEEIRNRKPSLLPEVKVWRREYLSLLLELQRVRKEMSELVVYDVEDLGKARADALEEAAGVREFVKSAQPIRWEDWRYMDGWKDSAEHYESLIRALAKKSP